MPRARESRYPVVGDLKSLSKEADNLTDDLSHEGALDGWFLSVKETIIKIRDADSVEELASIAYPRTVLSVFKQQNKSTENVTVESSENQKEHVHEGKQSSSTTGKNETAEIKQATEVKNSEVPESDTKNNVDSSILHGIHIDQNTKTQILNSKHKATNISCPVKKMVESQLCQESTPKMPFTHKNALSNTAFNSQELMRTPVANKAFNKVLNTTVILDSSNKTKHGSKIIDEVNNCSVFQSKSNSRRKVFADKSSNGIHESEMHPKTRSHLKRESSECKSESNKKQKLEVCGAPVVVSATKARNGKYPVIENVMHPKIGVSASENKAKVSAVIIPSMQAKQTPVLSKGRQILEEIKKKEEKANENRKKVMAERQMKAEENKKKREEKREKTLQKRLQMEKEREKREMESKKSPIKAVVKEVAKKPMKTRVKELAEQNAVQEKKSGILTSSKQNEANAEDALVPKTPTSQKSYDSDNYELTPMPDSSTYDFSEDEEDKPSGKHIPLWAQGVHLKSALIQQFYYPADTDEIFGAYIESPDLAEIFSVHKKCYKLRTSSAIWNSPPARSLKH